MRRIAHFALVALALALVGCGSMSGLQRVLIRGNSFTLVTGIAYGPEPRQRIDIYTPKDAPPKATILFLYGGSWKGGDRGLYRFLGQALAGRGYQLAVADYRLYPQVRYPAFVEDAAGAFAWVKSNISAYGGDPNRLFLMGHSAGAYNAAMIMIDGQWLAPHRLRPSDALGLISLAGPFSFNPRETSSTKDVFSEAPDINAARPVKLAANGAKSAPPMFLLHGTADDTVGSWNTQNFASAVNDAGGHAELILYPDIGHLGVITCFAWPLRWRAPCLDDVTSYMEKILSQPPAG